QTISGIGTPSRPVSRDSEARSELNCARSSGGKIFRMNGPSRPTTRLVPVVNTCGAVHARAWPRAISSATGNHCAASARQAWKAAILLTLGSECMIGDRLRKPVVSRGCAHRSPLRASALELAHQAVAALDRGIHRGLRGFLAAERLLQLVVDRVADQHEGAKPDSP